MMLGILLPAFTRLIQHRRRSSRVTGSAPVVSAACRCGKHCWRKGLSAWRYRIDVPLFMAIVLLATSLGATGSARAVPTSVDSDGPRGSVAGPTSGAASHTSGWFMIQTGSSLAEGLYEAALSDQGKLFADIRTNPGLAAGIASGLRKSGIEPALDVHEEIDLAAQAWQAYIEGRPDEARKILADVEPVDILWKPFDRTPGGGDGAELEPGEVRTLAASSSRWDSDLYGYLYHYHGSRVVLTLNWREYLYAKLNGFQAYQSVTLDSYDEGLSLRVISDWSLKCWDLYWGKIHACGAEPTTPSAGFQSYYFDQARHYRKRYLSEWLRFLQFHFKYDVRGIHSADGHTFGKPINKTYTDTPQALCYNDDIHADGCLWR